MSVPVSGGGEAGFFMIHFYVRSLSTGMYQVRISLVDLYYGDSPGAKLSFQRALFRVVDKDEIPPPLETPASQSSTPLVLRVFMRVHMYVCNHDVYSLRSTCIFFEWFA